MPRRTNPFQELVTLIERQLAGKGARVKSSELVKDDLTGESLEVDIVIETEAGGHPVTIGIECIGRGRPANVEWIRLIEGKFRDLPVNKRVAVSRSGFTKGALKTAARLHIETLSLTEAVTADWTAILDRLKEIKVESLLVPYLTGVTVNFEPDSMPRDPTAIDLQTAVLYGPTGNEFGTVKECVDRVIDDPAFVEMAQQKAFPDAGTTISLTIPAKNGHYILGASGEKHAIHSIDIEAQCRKETSTVPLTRASYGSAQVAIGSGQTFGSGIAIAGVARADSDARLGFSIERITKEGQPKKRKPKAP